MKTIPRKAARAAYDRIPEPDALTGALGMVLGLPVLLVVIFAASALS